VAISYEAEFVHACMGTLKASAGNMRACPPDARLPHGVPWLRLATGLQVFRHNPMPYEFIEPLVRGHHFLAGGIQFP